MACLDQILEISIQSHDFPTAAKETSQEETHQSSRNEGKNTDQSKRCEDHHRESQISTVHNVLCLPYCMVAC